MYVATAEDEHGWGDPEMNLLGGGFSQIKGTSATTSQHTLDTLLTPPGVDDYDDPGAAIRLVCMSCHTAHPDKNHAGQYRLLRARVNGITSPIDVGWNGPWDDETQSTKDNPDRDYRAYTERDWDPVVDGTQIYSKNYGDGISLWCTSCHTRYLTREDSEPYDAGDIYGEKVRFRHHADTSIKGVVDPNSGFTYDLSTDLPLADVSGDGRNNEDKMMCLTCHRSHGTDAVMTGEAVLSPVERVDLPTDSTLLRRDNRGVCGNCHTNI
jgi:hypothetical protein